MSKKIYTLLLFIAVSISNYAHAAYISQEAGIDFMQTDFNNVVISLKKFDSNNNSLQLQGIEFSLLGELESTAYVENFGSNSQTNINILINALLTLKSEFGDELVTSLPSLTRTFEASEFDGAADWAGTSGETFKGLYTSNRNSVVIDDQKIMSIFTGKGTVSTFLSSNADTRASGGGNIFSGFATQAKGTVNVTYQYTNLYSSNAVSIPEPGSVATMGLALLCLGASRRRKITPLH